MQLISLVGVLAFVVTSLVIGARLIWHARRAPHLPALAMGLALFLTGGLGYILLFVSLAMPDTAGTWLPLFQGAGLLCISTGSGALWVFTWRTFRPGERWATCLVAVAGAMLLLSYTLLAAEGGFAEPIRSGTKFWIGFVARALALVWAGAESFRYYGLMRRREALGLAEPLVTNRFMLWGIAATVGAISAAVSGVMIAMGAQSAGPFIAGLRMVMAGFGMLSAASLWLAFFPPEAYRRRFAQGTAESTPA